MGKYDLSYDNLLEYRDGSSQIVLYGCPGGYFIWQEQQNEDEFVFDKDELREFCENILEILDEK